MKKSISFILCLALLASLLTCTVFAEGGNPFTDVKEKDYYYEPVLWAVANSITTGTSKTTFSPDKPCTRAQVVTFLWRAAGSPEPTQTNNPFTDVPAGQYYYKAVLWAVEESITTGTSKTTFGPDKSCTRAQVVTFLWRAAGEPAPQKNDNPFKDVPQGQYYYNAVLWAVEEGITTGTSKTAFSPDKPCTRGQIVTFIYRYMTSDEPLTIVFQPDDYYMTSSQEDAEFSVTIKGGSAPYTYAWVTCYDTEEVRAAPVTSTGSIHVFTRNISDYDFDEHRDIGVFCVITDSKGNSVQTEMAEVHPFVRKPLAIASQPNDYRMGSSQEDAEFTVILEGGTAPYTYRWCILYDDEALWMPSVESAESTNTLTWNFSDYDFEKYRDIKVGCVVSDAKGESLQSAFAVVHQYTPKALCVISQPEEYRMGSSQEDAAFTVVVEGGSAPYTFQWVICYDNEEVQVQPVKTEDPANTLIHEFSDYDFEDYNGIGVYCIITDSKGATVESEFAIVMPKA